MHCACVVCRVWWYDLHMEHVCVSMAIVTGRVLPAKQEGCEGCREQGHNGDFQISYLVTGRDSSRRWLVDFGEMV